MLLKCLGWNRVDQHHFRNVITRSIPTLAVACCSCHICLLLSTTMSQTHQKCASILTVVKFLQLTFIFSPTHRLFSSSTDTAPDQSRSPFRTHRCHSPHHRF